MSNISPAIRWFVYRNATGVFGSMTHSDEAALQEIRYRFRLKDAPLTRDRAAEHSANEAATAYHE